MVVEFRKIGTRRYAVRALRNGYPEVEVNPAPGYDDRLPHDLVHFVVEVELGIERGVFGQLAAGGDSGTFRLGLDSKPSRTRIRAQRGSRRRGARLARSGHSDSVFSEHAANIALNSWLARSKIEQDRERAREMSPFIQREWEGCSPEEVSLLTEHALERIQGRFDQLSEEWTTLGIGESIALLWPHGNRAQP